VTYGLRYYEDFVRPHKRYRRHVQGAGCALRMADAFEEHGEERDPETVRAWWYEIGKTHGFEPLRRLVQGDLRVALGQEQGRASAPSRPVRMRATRVLIRTALGTRSCRASVGAPDLRRSLRASLLVGVCLGGRRICCEIARSILSRGNTKRPLPRAKRPHG